MSELTEAQTVTRVDPLDFSAPKTPAGGSVAPDATAVAPEAVTTEALATDPAPAAPSATLAPVDDITAAITQMTEGASAPTPWDDNAKNLFKQTFGAEDPYEFHKEVATRQEQFNLIKAENEQLTALKSDLEAMTPAMQRAIALMREGKDPLGYLKSLPDGVFQNKPAAELTDRQIHDTYTPGKVSEEKWAKLNDPDTDPAEVASIKELIGNYRAIGETKHEAAREQTMAELQSAQKAQSLAFENFQKGVAGTLANAKSSPLKAFVSQGHADEMSVPGKFLSRFLESDGITPKPDALLNVLKGERFDEAVKAARSVGYNKGREDGLLEATSKQPQSPVARRDAAPAPATQTTKTAYESTLDRIEQGAR